MRNRHSSSVMISESLEAVWAVELMRHQSQQYSRSLMIFESLGAVWAVDSMRHPSQQFVYDF